MNRFRVVIATIALGLAGAIAAPAVPAAAEHHDPPVDVTPDPPADIDLLGEQTTPGSPGSQGPSGPSSGGSSGPPPAPYAILDFDPATGESCVAVGWQPGPSPPGHVETVQAILNGWLAEHPWCPGFGPPTVTPEEAVRIVFQDRVSLLEPRPRIQPGEGIAGLEMFLEIGGPSTASYSEAAFGYPISITATSTYDIDWGDGTWTRGVKTQGGPWPDGDLRHVWTHRGTYDVVVHQHWTAAWSVGSYRGTISGLETQGSVPDFPVQELQAVRSR